MAEKKDQSTPKFTEFDESVAYGAMYDKHNIKGLTFWLVMGVSILLIIILGVIALFNYNKFQYEEAATLQSGFHEFEQIRADQNAHLNSRGIIDEEEGLYHISIDDAITLITNESEQ